MKKLSWKFLLMTGLMTSLFFACGDDEEDNPVDVADPTVTAPGDVTVNASESTPLSFTITIPGGYASANAVVDPASLGTASVTGTAPATDATSGTVEVTFTAGGDAGTGTVTLTVTDDVNQTGSASANVEVQVEDEPETPGVTLAADSIAAIDDLSTLADALEATGLDETLNGEGPFTIFAPNNDAFTSLLEALELADLPTVISELGDEVVSQLLQAHVVVGDSLGAAELTDGQELTTVNDSTLTIAKSDGAVTVNGAAVVEADIVVGNGVIHVIDSVINLPAGVGGPQGDSPVAQHLLDNNNVVADPALAGIGREATGALDPIPSGEAVTTDLAAYPEGNAFFNAVNYKGAFDPAGENWIEGWSSLWKLGYLVGSPATPEAPYDPATATIEQIPNPITENTTLTADVVWLLDGLTYVESGTLTIEPGTVIIAESDPTTGDNTSSLIVTSGGMIDAPGTAEAPIIFTSENDNGTLPPSATGEWGGIILLGTAPVGFGDNGIANIEGIDPVPNTQYGGTEAADNSGTMTYVSIRYSGVGLAPGDEIQGLTLGGVGSGTTLEYIDIFSSGDDGVEWFGGTVNLKYAIAAFVDDDNWDYDLGWRGNGQFWFSIQNDLGTADHGGEWDGADPDAAEPYSNPVIYNMTAIGRGQDATGRDPNAPAIIMRDNAAGTLANSIITDFNGKGIEIEDLADSEADSFTRLVNGEIQILNNIWFVNPGYTEISSGESGIVRLTE